MTALREAVEAAVIELERPARDREIDRALGWLRAALARPERHAVVTGRVEDFINAHSSRSWRAREIREALQLPKARRIQVTTTLARLAKEGRIRRVGFGLYQAVRP